jgi:hypothetical protein
MSTTLAELNDRVYLELGETASEFLPVDVVHNAVVQAHNLRASQTRLSSINVVLATTPQFTPTGLQYNVTSLIGDGTPIRVEYLADDGINPAQWIPMRVIPLASMSDYQAAGILAATFEGDDSATSGVDPVEYINFTFLPAGPVRIRFDRDLVRKLLTDDSLLPDHVAELMVKDAIVFVIPRLKLEIDVSSRRDPELRAIKNDLKGTLDDMRRQILEIDGPPLIALWKNWAFRDRGAETSFNKPTPSSRGLYGPINL